MSDHPEVPFPNAELERLSKEMIFRTQDLAEFLMARQSAIDPGDSVYDATFEEKFAAMNRAIDEFQAAVLSARSGHTKGGGF